MASQGQKKGTMGRSFAALGLFICTAIGAAAFCGQLLWGDAARAWQAYLINFLLFSALAHGALLFSTLMHTVKARWSAPLAALAEAFAAFFPVSLVMFLLLFIGRQYLFPWMGQELHGKQVWLNLPFLFGRDLAGLLVLYGLGMGYVYYARLLRTDTDPPQGALGRWLKRRWMADAETTLRYEHRKTVLGLLYMLAFALVLSLLGYDLVMSMDPHWYSTLFGAYSFIKSVYVGFGALIILAAVVHLNQTNRFSLKAAQFHDLGKLFFAFCLVWADFFYVQFVVIWYGNIPEETAYVIERIMIAPWRYLAWTVFAVCFVAPFLILLNKKIKTIPGAMLVICAAVIAGMWLEHLLLVGPALFPGAHAIPLSWVDPLILLGFGGLMGLSLTGYLRQFPEILQTEPQERR